MVLSLIVKGENTPVFINFGLSCGSVFCFQNKTSGIARLADRTAAHFAPPSREAGLAPEVNWIQ
jgi:hypothetical protein